MDALTQTLDKLKRDRYTGTVTFSFYQGNVSKKIKLETTKVLHENQKLRLQKNKLVKK